MSEAREIGVGRANNGLDRAPRIAHGIVAINFKNSSKNPQTIKDSQLALKTVRFYNELSSLIIITNQLYRLADACRCK